MDKIQLIFFFVSGFLVSRMIIKVKLPQRIVYLLIGQKQLSISRVLLYLISISAFLSFFIPNAITVLALLPVLELLRKSYQEAGYSSRSISTLLALSAIYGANIGGMGSVTATPANGLLVSYAEANLAAGTEYLTFAGWLMWGIPLAVSLVVIAWLILTGLFRVWSFRGERPIKLPFNQKNLQHPWQKTAVLITSLFFISSFILSIWIMLAPDQSQLILVITGVFTSLFCGCLFFYPLKVDKNSSAKTALLTIKDCYNDLPVKGFLFVSIALVIAGALYLLKVHVYFSGWIDTFLPAKLPLILLFFILAMVTSFTTEILTNTAVQIAMFLIVLPLAQTAGFSPVLALIIVTLSSTSAFMSPIATGVNGLAFGGVKDVSLTKMLAAGLVMNFAAALLITFWVFFVIGKVLGVS